MQYIEAGKGSAHQEDSPACGTFSDLPPDPCLDQRPRDTRLRGSGGHAVAGEPAGLFDLPGVDPDLSARIVRDNLS